MSNPNSVITQLPCVGDEQSAIRQTKHAYHMSTAPIYRALILLGYSPEQARDAEVVVMHSLQWRGYLAATDKAYLRALDHGAAVQEAFIASVVSKHVLACRFGDLSNPKTIDIERVRSFYRDTISEFGLRPYLDYEILDFIDAG